MTTSLKQLQENLQAYMLQGNDAIFSEVISTEQATATVRLDVYRDGYFLRLIDILAMDYPALKKIIGQNKFEQLGMAYIDAYPSHYFSVRIFGRYLSEFLKNQSDYTPPLSELASFEWKLAEITDASDAMHLTVADMSKILPESWGMMQLTLHPSVQIFPFFYNTADIWKSFKENTKKPKSKKYKHPVTILFWRVNFECYYLPLSEQQLVMFTAIQQHKNFGEICEELCEYMPEEEVIQFAAGTLRSWVSQGIFSAVQVEES